VADAERLAKLLAFSSGDLRDWPKRCGWCDSTEIEQSPYNRSRDVWHCPRCGHDTTGACVYANRIEDARVELDVDDQGAARAIVEEWVVRG
jgi:hypothetical protein